MSSRTTATLGIFTALVAALGFALSGIPNMELMTLGAFIAGAWVGVAGGAVVGALSIALYSGLNPYGFAPPPTFLMQVTGLALVGAAGGLLGPRLETLPGAPAVAVAAALGFGLTLLYDLLTNLGTAWSAGLDVVPTLIAGLTFGVWHMLWNAVFFALGAGPLLAVLRRRKARSA